MVNPTSQSIMVLQHRELSKLICEEKMLLDYRDMVPQRCKMQSEVMMLERQLCQLSTIEATNEQDCLVTKTVSLDEVRRELPEWVAPIRSEYESLKGHQAIEPLSPEQYR